MVALIAAFLLTFSGVFATAAMAAPDKQPDTTLDDHPSGNDRSVEPGNSGTQGKSESDPDKVANQGRDKPEDVGGFDSDKDGNNGCGNDDDFEDDNNGNCRGRVQSSTTPVTTTETTPTKTETTLTTPALQSTTSATSPSVLGVTLTREPLPAVAGATAVRSGALAATGFPTTTLVGFAFLLITLGALLVKRVGATTDAPTRLTISGR
jgi:hypothetical protein